MLGLIPLLRKNRTRDGTRSWSKQRRHTSLLPEGRLKLPGQKSALRRPFVLESCGPSCATALPAVSSQQVGADVALRPRARSPDHCAVAECAKEPEKCPGDVPKVDPRDQNLTFRPCIRGAWTPGAVCLSVCLSFSPSLRWAPALLRRYSHRPPLTIDSAPSSLVLTDFGECPRAQPGAQTCCAILAPRVVK